jgi:hypothetical protein
MRLYLRIKGALRHVLTFPVSAARRVREQVEKEDRERVIAHFVALDAGRSDATHRLMWRPSVRHTNRTGADDPLEQLWKLPAREPQTTI